MAKPRKPIKNQQGDPARGNGKAAPSTDPLGEQLLREAREGQAEFAAGWSEFMQQLGIQGSYGVPVMTLTVEATYENGMLKLKEPLPLKEHEQVEITIRPREQIQAAVNAVRRSAGMIPWTGDMETLERIVMAPEFGIEESP